ncbi:MAG: PBP1A family penicillin-binding protein, partial [Patescibacteria group bacterium]
MQRLPVLRRRYLIFGIVGILILSIVSLSFFILKDLPSPQKLRETGTIAYSSHIYDRNGESLYEIFREQNRTAVSLSEMPKYIKWATISIEDREFYTHQGVSLVGGVLRAARDTVLRKKLQGGSTITQQLVKSALLTPERTIIRKIKEIVLALLVERTYTKDQILEMYLNQVPYGGTAWGIEEAAKLYFGKKTKQLTLAEAALLAGLPQAPSLYSPYSNPTEAKQRQENVLNSMVREGYIKQAEYSKALKQRLVYKKPGTTIKAPHFVFYIKDILEREYGYKTVQEGGLLVYTTLDYPLQKDAEKIVKTEVEKLENYNVGNGAALVTRPSTGEILVMVGSKDFFEGQYGAYNVVTALRQPGSSIKPLNYAVGLDRKIVTPASVFLDIPTCFSVPFQKGYCPKNYDGQFRGPVQLRFALANSYNIPAVKMLAMNGLTEFVASASAFGISTFKDPSHYGLSLTLGGGEVRMTDMAKAFSVFSNEGITKDLVSILKVTDRNGRVLYEYKDPNVKKDIHKPLDYANALRIQGKRIISRDTSFLISHMLLDNYARSAAFGESSALVVPRFQAVSVKTGTTDDLKDNWTIGYTPNFLAVVWVGNNDNKPMNPYLVSGVTGAAPIWNKIMRATLAKQKDLWPKKPDTIVGMEVCALSGKKPTEQDGQKSCPTRFEYFIKGTEPKDPEELRKRICVDKNTGRIAAPGQQESVEDQ